MSDPGPEGIFYSADGEDWEKVELGHPWTSPAKVAESAAQDLLSAESVLGGKIEPRTVHVDVMWFGMKKRFLVEARVSVEFRALEA